MFQIEQETFAQDPFGWVIYYNWRIFWMDKMSFLIAWKGLQIEDLSKLRSYAQSNISTLWNMKWNISHLPFLFLLEMEV